MFRKEIQASFVPGKIKGLCSNHRVIILNRGRTEETDANFHDQNVQSKLRAHWLMALVGGGGFLRERSMYSAFPGNCSVSYLSFVYGRSLWDELNGGENSLHWKANMLPLFSIMTLWDICCQCYISQEMFCYDAVTFACKKETHGQ